MAVLMKQYTLKEKGELKLVVQIKTDRCWQRCWEQCGMLCWDFEEEGGHEWENW